MARPKNLADQQPPTEREIAPETVATIQAPVQPAYVPPAPRQMRVERQGSQSEPYTRRFPQIRGGVCEYCGVLDPHVPSQFQYKLCPHYRGMQARCTYCPETKDPDEVVYHSNMNVAEHPDNPSTLIMWCDSYDCSRAHEKRFRRATS
jgi:hypothetical protein